MADQAPDAVTHEAERVLRDARVDTLPVRLDVIADNAGIQVVPKPAEAGVSGMLIRLGNDFMIAYATHYQHEGFERFSIAHELGHYYLPDHVGHVLRNGDVHESRAGYFSRDRYEMEADRFAAALLMPRREFVAAIGRAGDGLGAIEALATLCKTSLTATAIRYADCARDEAVAIVVSKGDQIEFSGISRSFRRLRNVPWLQKGERVPRKTATYRLLAEPGLVLHAEREEGAPHFHVWFGDGPDIHLVEEAIGLGRYGRVLTVLTIEGGVDEEDDEDEAALLESWTPRFKR